MSVVHFHLSDVQHYLLPLGDEEKIFSKIGEFSFSFQGNKILPTPSTPEILQLLSYKKFLEYCYHYKKYRRCADLQKIDHLDEYKCNLKI